MNIHHGRLHKNTYTLEFFQAIVPIEDPTTMTHETCPLYDFPCVKMHSIEHNDWLEYYVHGDGDAIEGAVATSLYDWYDRIRFAYIPQDDSLAEDFDDIYQAMISMDTNYDISILASEYIRHIRVEAEASWQSRVQMICGTLTDNLIDGSSIPLCGTYRCGDANGDSHVDLTDVLFIICYIFDNCDDPQPPYPPDAGDANCDGLANIADAVYLIAYIFRAGPEPCCPSRNWIGEKERKYEI